MGHSTFNVACGAKLRLDWGLGESDDIIPEISKLFIN